MIPKSGRRAKRERNKSPGLPRLTGLCTGHFRLNSEEEAFGVNSGAFLQKPERASALIQWGRADVSGSSLLNPAGYLHTLNRPRATYGAMILTSSQRTILQSILSGVYTPADVREFVRLCYTLSLPLIRKRISQGKINLEALGLNQNDVVYDCIADLFIRDNTGHFTEIENFFGKEIEDTHRCSDALLIETLRRIVFGKVSANIIRIHSGADPAFGKILHNLDVALTRGRLFEKFVRFGETMLACCDSDLLLHLPGPPLEYLRQRLSHIVLIQDSMPAMLKKLYDILLDQQQFQRTIPLVRVGTLLKEVYALGAESEPESENSSLISLEEEDGARMVQAVCADLHRDMVPHYVGSGKLTENALEVYLQATKAILSDLVLKGRDDCKPYFEYLKDRIPGLSKEEYINRHKPILEHFVRSAKRGLLARTRGEQPAP